MKIEIDADNPLSKSGRKLTPIPRKKTSPSGRNWKVIDRLWTDWTMDNTKEEMKGCEYSQTLIKSMDTDNMSTSDHDSLSVMLFGDTHVKINYKQNSI